jgi:hypothetical protein
VINPGLSILSGIEIYIAGFVRDGGRYLIEINESTQKTRNLFIPNINKAAVIGKVIEHGFVNLCFAIACLTGRR